MTATPVHSARFAPVRRLNLRRLVPFVAFVAFASAGCGTTRWSDTSRTATEQLVLSHAVDRAVSDFDFSPLAGTKVFLDSQYVDDIPNKGYLISSIRQQILANGCLLQEDKAKADYVVEARAGASGTDRHDQLILGLPQIAMPSIGAGVPSMIPEIPLVKKTNQQAAAKIAVFVYNRNTGEAVWQSGIAQHSSNAKNYWVFGAGPFESGSSRRKTTFGGVELGVPTLDGQRPTDGEYAEYSLPVARRIAWQPVDSGVQAASASIESPTAPAKNGSTNTPPSAQISPILLGE